MREVRQFPDAEWLRSRKGLGNEVIRSNSTADEMLALRCESGAASCAIASWAKVKYGFALAKCLLSATDNRARKTDIYAKRTAKAFGDQFKAEAQEALRVIFLPFWTDRS